MEVNHVKDVIAEFGLDDLIMDRGWQFMFSDRNIERKVKALLKPGVVTEVSCTLKEHGFHPSIGKLSGVTNVQYSGFVRGASFYATKANIIVHEDKGVRMETFCTCPVGSYCKHAYALMETVAREIESSVDEEFDEEELKESLAQIINKHEVSDWLGQIENMKVEDAASLAEIAKTKKKQLAPLGYLIKPVRYDRGAFNLFYMRVMPEGDRKFRVVNEHLRVPTLTAKYITEQDRELIASIDQVCRYEYYGDNLVCPKGEPFLFLINQLRESQRLFYAEQIPTRGGLIQSLEVMDAQETSLGWQSIGKSQKRPVLTSDYRTDDFFTLDPITILDEGKMSLQPLLLPAGVSADLACMWASGPVIAEASLAEVERSKVVQEIAPIESNLIERVMQVEPTFILQVSREQHRAHFTHLKLSLFVDYDGKTVACEKRKNVLSEPLFHQIISEGDDRVQIYLERDVKEERGALRQMSKTLDLVPYREVEQWKGEGFYDFHQREYAASQGAENDFSLPYTPEVTPRVAEATFLSDTVKVAEEMGWQVQVPDEIEVPEIEELKDDYGHLVKEQDEGGIDWFRFDAGFVDGEGAEVSMREALADFIARVDLDTLEDYSEDATIMIDDPNSGKIFRIPARRFVSMAQKVRDLFRGNDDKMDQVRAAVFADDFQLDTSDTFRALAELGKKLKTITEIPKVKKPRNLKADLRPYQQEGFQWLQFLHNHGLNGVLADDMGLGKTLQTIAHLLAQHNSKDVKVPSLVVAPTSVTTNWMREMEKFAPKLKAILLQGKERHEHWDKLNKYDVVVTSYALTVRDEDRLKEQEFHTVVLDEAQYIKNSKAKVSRMVCQLACRHRVCLSGTPLENHLGELWSLTRFLMPGLLGDETTFRSEFRTPIEKHNDSEAQVALTRKVKPLILRRTKEEVATELPKKTEITNTVTLGDEQTALYEAIRAVMDKKVRDAINSKGVSQSQIIFLDAMLKLRQTCCDPRLLKDAKQKKTPSAKFNYLTTELLPVMLEEGRKILLFSQFTTMLGLIEDHLKKEKITYSKLTGATRKRDEQIQQFQEGDAQVFLISLKAGGTGLNLTAADTVIHYDPWWNPAAENQATDRAHRMGQTKPVFVHRLICAGSIEERIQELQKQKSDLAESLLSGSMKKVSLDEKTLNTLLAPLT